MAWHLATLAIAFIGLVYLQRDQWFFFDEWAFIEPHHPGLFAPHVGHWSSSPLLVFILLRRVFGLGSYLPFAVAVTTVHLVVAHLTWRISVRASVSAWIATLLASVILVMGAGAENILWGFQVGFLGAIAWGLLAFHMAQQREVGPQRLGALVAIGAFALTWSGTALPLVVATAALLWFTRRRKQALIFAGALAVIYLAWFVAFARGSAPSPDTGGLGPLRVLVHMFEFIGVMTLLGYQTLFPIWGLGAVVLIALGVFLLRSIVRKRHLDGLVSAAALTGAAVIFAALTAYSRAGLSIGSGRSSRYVYFLAVLLMPLCGVALSRLVARGVWLRVGAAVSLLAIIAYQGVGLANSASAEARREAASARVISASIYLWLTEPDAVNLAAQPDPQWAPDVNLADVIAMYENDGLSIRHFDPGDLEQARANVGVGD